MKKRIKQLRAALASVATVESHPMGQYARKALVADNALAAAEYRAGKKRKRKRKKTDSDER